MLARAGGQPFDDGVEQRKVVCAAAGGEGSRGSEQRRQHGVFCPRRVEVSNEPGGERLKRPEVARQGVDEPQVLLEVPARAARGGGRGAPGRGGGTRGGGG